eukprot:1375228-Prymnesium_polylepis.1
MCTARHLSPAAALPTADVGLARRLGEAHLNRAGALSFGVSAVAARARRAGTMVPRGEVGARRPQRLDMVLEPHVLVPRRAVAHEQAAQVAHVAPIVAPRRVLPHAYQVELRVGRHPVPHLHVLKELRRRRVKRRLPRRPAVLVAPRRAVDCALQIALEQPAPHQPAHGRARQEVKRPLGKGDRAHAALLGRCVGRRLVELKAVPRPAAPARGAVAVAVLRDEEGVAPLALPANGDERARSPR